MLVQQQTTLSFLSWNLAMFERSTEAPATWGEPAIEAYVREQVLAVEPDVVAFQELPGLVPYVETHDMVRANPRSHSGNLATLVANSLHERLPTPKVIERCALLSVFDWIDLTIANVHLSPSKAGSDERLHQLGLIVAACETSALVIVGDTNTRVEEMNHLGGLGLSAPELPSPTWDGRRNRFRHSSEFRAYFTRVFHNDAAAIDELFVYNEAIEIDGARFFASDHFALGGRIRVITEAS